MEIQKWFVETIQLHFQCLRHRSFPAWREKAVCLEVLALSLVAGSIVVASASAQQTASANKRTAVPMTTERTGAVTASNPNSKSDALRSLKDERVIELLRSRNQSEVSAALAEVMHRGARLIPLLAKSKGKQGDFCGVEKLGEWGPGTVVGFDDYPCKADGVTFEVASLFLINAIYYDDIEFAGPPTLCDRVIDSRGETNGKCGNDKKRLRAAWTSVDRWLNSLRRDGIEAVRKNGQAPLSGAPVFFFGTEAADKTNPEKTSEPLLKRTASFSGNAYLDADVIGFEEFSPSKQWIGSVRTQILLLRIKRLIRGRESSRYIVVHNLFGGNDQPLSSRQIAKLKRFSLTRDRNCDTATGEIAGHTLRLKLVGNEATTLPGDVVLPCYYLFPGRAKRPVEVIKPSSKYSSLRGSVGAPFAEVSAPLRSRLLERLKLLIEYDRTQQWEKVYGLLSDRFTQGETKEHFISRQRYVYEKLGGDELVDFTPQAATALTPDNSWWFIRGCGEFKSSGRSTRLDSVVEGFLQNGEWYFSQIRPNTPVDGSPKSCQQPRGHVRKTALPIQGGKDPFATIPPEQQTKLLERLGLFVAAQSERRWNDVYDLTIDAIQGAVTREAFVREFANGFPNRDVYELLGFVPTAGTLTNINADAKEWLIEGCAKYQEKGKIVYQQAGLNAGLYSGQWYFSYLSELTNGVDGPPLPCTERSKLQLNAQLQRRQGVER